MVPTLPKKITLLMVPTLPKKITLLMMPTLIFVLQFWQIHIIFIGKSCIHLVKLKIWTLADHNLLHLNKLYLMCHRSCILSIEHIFDLYMN